MSSEQKSVKDGWMADHEPGEVYAIEAGTVFEIAMALINLLLTFVEPEKAKAMVDKAAIARANAIADAAQKAAGL